MTAPAAFADAQAPLVVITGASSGIGQALAQRYAQAGWRLALIARQAPALQAWVDAQGWRPPRCCVYAADVRDIDALVAAGHQCLTQQGLPEVVIANAGISVGMDTAVRDDLEVMRETLDTNVLGLAATFHPFVAPMCAARRGTLVGMASVAGVRGLPGHGAYCASKAAAAVYCESLRGDLRAHGVRVVTLAPGYVATPMTAGNRFPMPFLISADVFARRAMRAIARGRSHQIIPWPMAWVALALRLMPNALFDRLLAGRPRKPRRGQT